MRYRVTVEFLDEHDADYLARQVDLGRFPGGNVVVRERVQPKITYTEEVMQRMRTENGRADL